METYMKVDDVVEFTTNGGRKTAVVVKANSKTVWIWMYKEHPAKTKVYWKICRESGGVLKPFKREFPARTEIKLVKRNIKKHNVKVIA